MTTPEIDAILAAARDAGAFGGKVCGAGGGGCLFCLGEPERIPAIREAIAAAGGRLLDFNIEPDGLRVGHARHCLADRLGSGSGL